MFETEVIFLIVELKGILKGGDRRLVKEYAELRINLVSHFIEKRVECWNRPFPVVSLVKILLFLVLLHSGLLRVVNLCPPPRGLSTHLIDQ